MSQSLPRARGKEALALPVAEKARAPFPQRSKTARISVSPQQFSGTARWTGGPLCVPCGYAVDEVPAKRIKDSIVPGLVGRGTVPCPTVVHICRKEKKLTVIALEAVTDNYKQQGSYFGSLGVLHPLKLTPDC